MMMRAMARECQLIPLVPEMKWRATVEDDSKVEGCFGVDELNFQNSHHLFDEDNGGSSWQLQQNGKPTWSKTEGEGQL